jgi:lipoprotein-releasing system permease protein
MMDSWAPFEWTLAIRFLRQGSFQTFLTVTGAAVGVAVIVFMSALLAAVQNYMFARVLSNQAHVVIAPIDELARPLRDELGASEMATLQNPMERLASIDQWQNISAALSDRQGISAVSAIASGAAFAIRGDLTKPISLQGIDSSTYFKIVDIPGKIQIGSAYLGSGEILLGTTLASDFGIGLGEKLRVTAGTNRSNDQIFIVVGVFDLGSRDANERTVYVPLRAAQTLLGVRGGVTSIAISLSDPYDAEIVAAELRGSLGVNAKSWIDAVSEFFTALHSQRLANLIIRFFVAVAVALGIASVLMVTVVQRTSEIGILRAMGTSRGQVLRVFLLQGGVIGLLGSVVGSAVGIGFVFLWRTFARNPDGTQFFVVTLSPSLFVATSIIATLTGVLTAILPALGAARLNPVDAIRG